MKTFKIYFSLAGRSIQGFMYVFSGIINKSEISSRFLNVFWLVSTINLWLICDFLRSIVVTFFKKFIQHYLVVIQAITEENMNKFML